MFNYFHAYISDISVKIISSGSTTPGHNTSLTCMVDGLNGNLNASVTYQWSKANKILTQIRTLSPDLSFAPLRLSDAGNYTCQVLVDSNHLNRSINVATFKLVYVESESFNYIAVCIMYIYLQFQLINACVLNTFTTHAVYLNTVGISILLQFHLYVCIYHIQHS